ncbi:MAG: SLC13 family permease [Desulfurococcaceae archaeon]
MLGFKTAIGLSIVVLLISALIIRGRKPQIPIWSVMAFASFITIASGLVNTDELGSVIDLDVILFLIGMFSITGLAESSGLLNTMTAWFLGLFKNTKLLIYAFSALFGLLAAIAMNDTVALIGPPMAYTIAKALDINPTAMFLLLAYSLTIGSAMTPIGNPQNVLIAEKSGLTAPFLKFTAYLTIPTIINLLVTPLIVAKYYGIERSSANGVLIMPHEQLKNKRDAVLAGIGMAVSISALIVNDTLDLMGLPHISHRGFIPFVIAAALYPLSSEPRKVIASVDWGTILFFMTMFISMEGVWRSRLLDFLVSAFLPVKHLDVAVNIASITALSILGSQLISNVPFARLIIEYMKSVGYTGGDELSWITLAMSTTIAGNLTPLGAASNIIIIEYLESKMNTTITFKEFLKLGAIVTVVNALVYMALLEAEFYLTTHH